MSLKSIENIVPDFEKNYYDPEEAMATTSEVDAVSDIEIDSITDDDEYHNPVVMISNDRAIAAALQEELDLETVREPSEQVSTGQMVQGYPTVIIDRTAPGIVVDNTRRVVHHQEEESYFVYFLRRICAVIIIIGVIIGVFIGILAAILSNVDWPEDR